jgi:hypothetical protein
VRLQEELLVGSPNDSPIDMTKAEVIHSATRFAREQGYDPERYDVEATQKNSTWEIRFYPQATRGKPEPGDFFTVHVNAVSKSAERLIPGK